MIDSELIKGRHKIRGMIEAKVHTSTSFADSFAKHARLDAYILRSHISTTPCPIWL